jgi:hypothetical protein
LLPTVSFFLLFTLACSDVLSLPIAGGNFRLFYIAGMLAFALRLPQLRFDPPFSARVLLLFVMLTPSFVVSGDQKRSMLYLVWVLLTLVCTFGAFPRLVRFDPNKGPMLGPQRLYDALLYAFRFQIVVGIFLFAIGMHDRTRFFYYESSYFSISLAVYCAIVAHRMRERRPVSIDVALVIAFLITSASGAFVLVLLLTAMLNLPRLRVKQVMAALLAICVSVVAYVALVDDTNTTLVRSVLSSDADFHEVLLRGGNRLARLVAAWDVFNDHPAFGIGLGTFETASQSLDIDDPDTMDYLKGEGKPAINIYLELLATAGVAGLVGFAVVLWPLMRWIFGRGFRSPLSRGVICMLLVLTWESNFLRPYLWVMLALCSAEMQHSLGRDKPLLRQC